MRTIAPAIAPWWHTVIVLLVIGTGIVLSVSSSGATDQGSGVSVYLSILCVEWVLFGLAWSGTRQRTTLRELIGVRWSGRQALITIGFWLVFEGVDTVMHLLLHTVEPANVAALLPHTAAQALFWILLSISAGICEEFVYRAYLQRQFTALTRSAAAGAFLQAVVFGVSHGYQGWKQVITITVLGVLYGALVQWQRSILPGMVSHAWADIISGWFNLTS